MSRKRGPKLVVSGIPRTAPDAAAAICRSRLLSAVQEILDQVDSPELVITVGTERGVLSQRPIKPRSESDSVSPDRYKPMAPYYQFEQLVVPRAVREELLAAIAVLRVEEVVFDHWGLRSIEPFPRTALNFQGPPGTGKTLAAHALAHRLSLPILVASYAEIESKFHGDGPKNVKAIFQSAETENAVLFIDEADSLLSRRLTNVTQGSEQAINSMRSQLLICLEQFHGLVVFSTNLVQNYDKAFETRVRHIHFPLPDQECRTEIWARHLPEQLPLAEDVDCEDLGAALDDICGRDIKNAVIDAAVRVAISDRRKVHRDDLVSAIERLKAARVTEPSKRALTTDEADEAKRKIVAALRSEEDSAGAEGETEPRPDG